MWYLLAFLLQFTLTQNLVSSTNSTNHGNETRKHDNTSSIYTVVTSFSRGTEISNATKDTNAVNNPITVNVFSSNDKVNNGGRSNITQNDGRTGNNSKIVTISTVDARAKNTTNKTNAVNNTAVLNAFFPVIHAAMIATTGNNTANKGKVGSNSDIIQGSKDIQTNNTIKNYNNTVNNSSPVHHKPTNATNANQTTAFGKIANYTGLMKNSENNTQIINTRNDTKLVNNSLAANVFPDTKGDKGAFKIGTKNETDHGNMGNYTNAINSSRNDVNTNNTATTPIPIPITNPITNTVTNTVTNEVVNPFETTESPIIQEETNITNVKVSDDNPADNSTIDFPDATPITEIPRDTKNLNNGTSNEIKANNTTITNTFTSNTTKSVNNSVSENDLPMTGEIRNLTNATTNETKPVNISISMKTLSPVRKEMNASNVVTNATNPVNNSVSQNDSLFVYKVRKATYIMSNNSNSVNTSVLTSALPTAHDVRNATNAPSNNNNSVARSTSPIVHGARNNTTTNSNKSANNSVKANFPPFITGRGNTTNVNNKSNKANYITIMKTTRNATKTRSINTKDVAEYVNGMEVAPDSLTGSTRPANHVTVLRASDASTHKKKVIATPATPTTPESEMMDANTLHPTALMEYYELRDDGTETCDGRTDGTYAISDVTKYLLCRKGKVRIMPCDGDLVYDVNVQQCTPRSNVNRDRFCRFRGDGTWDSPWNTRMTIQCSRGFITSESCKHDLHYDPELKDCIQETLFIRCFAVDRDYTNAKLGCFRKGKLKMDMLINDLPGSRGKHILDWSKFADSVESLVCRCSKEAYAKGYPFFAIRLWAECWAGRNRTELEALLSDESQKNEQFCYSNISIAAFDKCTDNDTRVCVGSEHGQYLYNIVNVTEVNMGATANNNNNNNNNIINNNKNKAASRSQINNQVDFIDLVTLTELQKIQSTGKLHLIDVREGFEYDDIGSIKDSINIPLKDLAKALLLPDKAFKTKYGINKPAKDDCGIVFLCSSGVRSDMAYKIAKDIGYKCPKSLKGGYDLLPKIPVKK